ncbi:MAG: 3-dehydroquinate synthase [Proteobacteria bacterium]|nr:MAG: 3-dehydroquinate synthase [Pseudomonadota bacterium]
MTAIAAVNQEIVRVGLGARGYDIVVGPGILKDAGRYVAPLLKQRRTVIVSDETVARLHLDVLIAGLRREGITAEMVTVPPGEGSKSFAGLEALIDRLLSLAVERGDVIMALGGGVIGDLTGFAASILRRGVDFIQAPTTLLAQVDSSVGGKTGINTRHGKNLVGAFHQPRLVLADIDALTTLPARELRAGYAEVVKYGLLGDAAFFNWLEAHGQKVLALEPAAVMRAVVASCRMKADIVAEDEREAGRRALLNLGHTFGHALEAELGFSDRLLHGEAVAAGMVLAFELSVRLGLCPASDAARLRQHLQAAALPVKASDIGAALGVDALRHHMDQDKKVAGGRLTFVLAHGIGRAFLSRDVPEDALRQTLTAFVEA